MVVANATGCSSIYGGNQPTTPWAKNKEGRGPAWANSLFEDNAEFGLGMRLAITKHAKQALSLLEAVNVPAELKEKLTTQKQDDEAGLNDRTSQMQKKKLRYKKRQFMTNCRFVKVEVRRVELLSKITSPFIPTCVSFVFKFSSLFTPKKAGANRNQL